MPRRNPDTRPTSPSALSRSRRAQPRVEPLEGRALLTIQFTSALGIGAITSGSSTIHPYGVAVDSAGDTFVTGSIAGQIDFDPSADTAVDTNPSQGPDPAIFNTTAPTFIFVAKYNPAGSLIWAHAIGDNGLGTSRGLAIAVDPAGDVYTTGEYSGTVNFNPDPNGTPHVFQALRHADIFAWKLDPNGNYLWAQRAVSSDGAGADGFGIAVDPSNRQVFITGDFQGTATFGATALVTGGATDPFVARLDASGNWLWAKDFKGTGTGTSSATNSQGKGIAIDAADNLYTTGLFAGTTNFNPGGSFPLTASGGADPYVSKLDASGNFLWAKSFGGPGYDQGVGLAVDPGRNVFAVGEYSGTANFNPDPNGTPTFLTSPGSTSTSSTFGTYISKFDTNGNFLFARDSGVSKQAIDAGRAGIAIDAAGEAIVTGTYESGTTFGSFVGRMTNTGVLREAQALPDAGGFNFLGVAANTAGTIALTGSYNATSQPTIGPFTLPSALGPSNLYLATMRVQGSIPGNYFGLGVTNLGVFDATTSTLFVVPPATATGLRPLIQQFGDPSHRNVPVSGDYYGGGVTNLGIFDATTSTLYVVPTDAQAAQGARPLIQQFGDPSHRNIPVVGDYYGTGQTDLGIFDATTSTLFVVPPATATGLRPLIQQFGDPSHNNIPVVGDHTGDGKADLGIYDATSATFFIIKSDGSGALIQQLGDPSHKNIPVAGDYYGTGKADLGVFDATTSTLYVFPPAGTTGLKPLIQQFGDPSHRNIPVVGDYYGTGQTDLGVFDATTSTLFVVPPATATGLRPLIQQFGDPSHNNIPVPSPALPSGQVLAQVLAVDPGATTPTAAPASSRPRLATRIVNDATLAAALNAVRTS